MKSVDRYKLGTQYDTTIFGDGSSSTSNYQVRTGYENITPAGTTSGNFKDPNPWGYEIQDWSHLFGRFHKQWGGYQQIVDGPVYAPSYEFTDFSIPSFDDNNLYNTALSRLNEKVRGSLDLSVALGELGSTNRMVKAALSAERYTRDFKALRSIRTFSKLASNIWLEYTYGWKPLANDIYQAADESMRFVLNKLEKISASANERNFPGATTQKTVMTGGRVPFTTTYEGIHGYRITISLEHPSRDIARWTSLNPLSIAWELMPYSFVVDWAYDVGSYLRNFETALLYGANFRGGYVDHLLALDCGGRAGNSSDFLFFTGKSSLKYRRFQRSVLTSYPFPAKPQFEVKMGSSRLLSAAALLRQLIK